MTDADILTILKTDLMVSSSALDTYLQTLIASAKDYISTEGITLADSQSDGIYRTYFSPDSDSIELYLERKVGV